MRAGPGYPLACGQRAPNPVCPRFGLPGMYGRFDLKLQAAHLDRTAGVLVAQAWGDALGVPYEFSAPPSGEPEMKGGGLRPYAPGEYSDDTQMAVCIAEVAAKGLDLTSDALEIAKNGFDVEDCIMGLHHHWSLPASHTPYQYASKGQAHQWCPRRLRR